MKTLLGLFLLLVFLAPCLVAHPVDPCLARVAQLAQGAKQCELKQQIKGQCDDILGDLNGQIQVCKLQLFTEHTIDAAVEYGYTALDGDVSQSPYRRQVKQEQWEYQMMKSNLLVFQRYFPGADHVNEALAERFNSRECPRQYMGDPERYRYFGSETLVRYPPRDNVGEGEAQGEPVQYLYHWFSAERPGVCYEIPSGMTGVSAEETAGKGVDEAQEKIVNVPGYFLSELESLQSVKVIRCQSNCLEERALLADLHDQYARQYRLHRQLLVCSDVQQRNNARKVVKGQRRSAIKLPDYCPKDEVEVAELNARGLVEQLEQRLFMDVSLQIETDTAKSE